MGGTSKHERVNDILLGPLERPALRWLAAHMQKWVTPDFCTGVGVLGAVGILVSYGLTARDPIFLWAASGFYVVNWFGDSLDGTLARFRKIERPIYGFFLDHTVDAVVEVMIFLGFGLTPHVSYVAASAALIAYLLLAILVYVRTAAVGEFRISYGKLGPTEIRVLAILLNSWMYFGGVQTMSLTFSPRAVLTLSPYDLAMGAIALLLLWYFVSTAWRQTLALRDADK
jgi:phosphatidylglycerophosphate synthase